MILYDFLYIIASMNDVSKYKVVDLFSGCGGLSLGLEMAGFSLELAVEKSPMAAETYYHNFINKINSENEWSLYLTNDIEEQAKHKLVVDDIKNVVNSKKIIDTLKNKNIDLLVGGPPCQGFSLAGRRNPDDTRNQMPWFFLDMVKKIKPKAVIMENVVGINSKFDAKREAPLFYFKSKLSSLDYVVQPVLLNAYHYGVPQQRPRIMLIAIEKKIAEQLDLKIYDGIWKSDYAIKDKNYKYYSLTPRVIRDNKNLTVNEAFCKIPSNALNHNKRKHSELTINRFRLYQYFQKNNISAKVLNYIADKKTSDLQNDSNLLEMIKNINYPAKSPDNTILANNKNEFIDLLIKLSTKKHSQRTLNGDLPSPTIVTIPDDYVHPFYPRTLTVREMATLQSFPLNFEFKSKETTGGKKRKVEVPQYTQVGNAVPPKLAQKVGETILKILIEAENYNLK